jgi:hypothetical protein
MNAGWMKRRAFIAALGGAAAWPVMTRAQQTDRVRRIGVLFTLQKDDPFARQQVQALLQGLQEAGRNIAPLGMLRPQIGMNLFNIAHFEASKSGGSVKWRSIGSSRNQDHGRAAVSISNLANSAFGEHRRHDCDGIRLRMWRRRVVNVGRRYGVRRGCGLPRAVALHSSR